MNDESTQDDLEIRVDAGAREARVVVPAESDASDLDASVIIRCARDRGVIVNDDVEQRIKDFVAQHRSQPSLREAVIAEATQPVNGRDGRIEWIEGFDPNAPPRDVTSSPAQGGAASDERKDFHKFCKYVKVDAGTHVATLIPATCGIDGTDVKGMTIKASPGRDCEIDIDPTLSVDDAGRVTASISGVLQMQQRTLRVTRILEVEAYVDFSTGNVNCDGSVVVAEGIRDCFTVKATEDVTVHGLIEAATIICGRNLFCRRGMAARDRGFLIVEGDAEIGFLNNVRGRIRRDLVVHNELMNCQIAVGGRLDCGRGSIVGGTTIVTGAVSVGTLGADAGTLTTLILGVEPFLGARIARLEAHDHTLRRELRELLSTFQSPACSGGAEDSDDHDQTWRFSTEIALRKQKIEACTRKMRDFQQQLADSRMLDLTVAKVIHPRVTLKVYDREVHFHEPLTGPVRIFWDEGRHIRIRQGDGPIRDISEVARDYRMAA